MIRFEGSLQEVRVKIGERTVGHITPKGRWLIKEMFWALAPTNRIRVYLALVAPALRSHHTLVRVCGLKTTAVYNCLMSDVRKGLIERVHHDKKRTSYRLRREHLHTTRVYRHGQ